MGYIETMRVVWVFAEGFTQSIFIEGYRSGILHTATIKVRNDQLIVFTVGVGNIKKILKVGKTGAGQSEPLFGMYTGFL